MLGNTAMLLVYKERHFQVWDVITGKFVYSKGPLLDYVVHPQLRVLTFAVYGPKRRMLNTHSLFAVFGLSSTFGMYAIFQAETFCVS